MTLPTQSFEPTSNDFRLIEEAIRRATQSTAVPERHTGMLRTALIGELSRGRRDMFSLVRAARRAVETL